MGKYIVVVLFSLLVTPVWAALNVLSTVPEWAALAKEIGGERVDVFSATHARQDPHRIEARPSLIAKARSANLVIATGADLEIGWLPLLLRESGNPQIQPGQPGYLDAAMFVKLRDIPKKVDRSMGDVHPGGDPHFHLNPHNFLPVAQALTERLVILDPAGAEAYRANHRRFSERWKEAIQRWEREGAVLKGVSFLQVHRSFGYLAHWLGMQSVGELEPKPGVEPTSGNLTQVLGQQKLQPAAMVLRATYQSDTAGRWISERAGIPLVVLPYTVGGSEGAKDLFGLFDDTLARLKAGAK